MSLHARPHLETHRRGSGHSAVAGVAYRLGLRLLDRRTGVWHDYRKRQLGEEIVRALTIAPEGAPMWATDPDELWNRCEAAEKRKDSQVARDYRIPIPLGLTDRQAGDMSEEMARFISRQLHTAVSLGLHRDSHIDALGAEKPEGKIGFHAHLYFPTRRLEEIVGEDGTSEWAPGAKLVLLSNRTTSSAFVEQLNEKWADLANRYTAAVGLTADFDHRSYVRQELPITPQPTLGAAVTAMERRGFFTRRGDALRGDIMVPSLVYEAAHAVDLADQRARAADDVVREAVARVLSPPEVALSAAGQAGVAPVTVATVAGPAAPEPVPDPDPVLPAPPPLGPRPAAWEQAPTGSLTSRFMAAVPQAATAEEEEVRSRLEKVVSGDRAVAVWTGPNGEEAARAGRGPGPANGGQAGRGLPARRRASEPCGRRRARAGVGGRSSVANESCTSDARGRWQAQRMVRPRRSGACGGRARAAPESGGASSPVRARRPDRGDHSDDR
jgi:hypothetical protein